MYRCKPILVNELHRTFWEVSPGMLCRSNLMGIPLMVDVVYASGQMRSNHEQGCESDETSAKRNDCDGTSSR